MLIKNNNYNIIVLIIMIGP